MSTSTGGPAFPGLHPSAECRYNDPGMSLRDYFAAKAMQQILASQYADGIYVGDADNTSEHVCAASAYIMADAMLKARDA